MVKTNQSTTESSRFLKLNQEEISLMIPYNRVAAIAWDEQMGVKLRKLRDAKNLSRAGLSRIVKAIDKKLSQQYIQKLEEGDALSVRRETLEVLLNSLEANMTDLFPCLIFQNALFIA